VELAHWLVDVLVQWRLLLGQRARSIADTRALHHRVATRPSACGIVGAR
jgi:hypothetical protein